MNIIKFGCGVPMTTESIAPRPHYVKRNHKMADIYIGPPVSSNVLKQTDDLVELFRHVLDNNVRP